MPTLILRRLRTAAGLVAALVVLAAPARAQGTAVLAGTVVDGDTGETLIGANVFVEELATGAASDLDGNYRIARLPAGTYTVRFSYAGFATQRVTDVRLVAGQTQTLDITLSTESLGEVVVTADAIIEQNSDTGLLRLRARAAAVSDAISAESIARAGASTAAEAIQRVPGASVVGGRGLVVRGLSDRYLNVQLNGATLPSTDPERQSAPLDLFPSSLLDNIVTSKSFTPDRPGAFTGGLVDITTRSFPDRLTAQLSVSSGYNSAVASGGAFSSIPGGGVGVFGNAPGGLALPAAVVGLTPRDISSASGRDRADVTNAFGSTFAAQSGDASVNTGLSGSVGNRTTLFGKPLGFIVGGNWARSTGGYEGGVVRDFSGAGTAIDQDYELATQVGEQEVLYGGIANLNLQPTSRSQVGLNLIANRNAVSRAVYQTGLFSDGTLQEADNVYQGRSLIFTERSLLASQLRGEHALTTSGTRLDWTLAASRSALDEPDFRIFQNEVDYSDPATGTADYLIRSSAYEAPSRTFRSLGETGLSGGTNLSLALGERAGRPATLKVGGAFDVRSREFRERSFLYPIGAGGQRLLDEVDGDPNALIAMAAERGLYIDDATNPDADYDGTLQVYAGYAMLDAAVLPRLRFVGGLRYEFTDLSVTSPKGYFTFGGERIAQGGYTAGGLDALLGSASVVYSATPTVNLRLAYGRTLARPSFREVAPRSVFSLFDRITLNGNPALRQTSVHNLDARAEWFTRPGEILAVSAFYKRFQDPIELTFLGANNQFRPENLGDADLLGVELEARRRLDFLPGTLSGLMVGGNLSLVRADVALTPTEQASRASTATTRPLEGQSPYVGNLDLGYVSDRTGTALNVFYNVFGDRLFAVSRGPVPDLYEAGRPTVDVTASQRLPGGVALKLSAKNLLGADYRLVHRSGEFDIDLERQRYGLGRSFSFGLSYSL